MDIVCGPKMKLHNATYSSPKNAKNNVFWLSLLLLVTGWPTSVDLNGGFSWALHGLAEFGRLQWVSACVSGRQGVGRCRRAAPFLHHCKWQKLKASVSKCCQTILCGCGLVKMSATYSWHWPGPSPKTVVKKNGVDLRGLRTVYLSRKSTGGNNPLSFELLRVPKPLNGCFFSFQAMQACREARHQRFFSLSFFLCLVIYLLAFLVLFLFIVDLNSWSPCIVQFSSFLLL